MVSKNPFAAACALLASLAIVAPALASPASDAVSTCLTDNTNGKDRKDLARWIFIAMAAHPDMKDLSSVNAKAAEESSRRTAALLTRLITESCPTEIRKMVAAEGQASISGAFEFLGRSAMLELNTNPEVARSIQDFQRYVDTAKIQAVITPPR